MTRTMRSAKLDSRSARSKLSSKPEPYWIALSPGHSMGYYKPPQGAGTWRARRYLPETRTLKKTALGTADDYQDADGAQVLSFSQAQVKASEWFLVLAREANLADLGEAVASGPYTVKDAVTDYLRNAERRGMKGLKITTQTANAHILPALGAVEVSKLSKRRIEEWHLALAEAPRRKTGKLRTEGAAVAYLDAPSTEDEKRARKDTANRILTVLRAALNLALRENKVGEPAVWRKVEPFKGVGASRVRFLNAEEQIRILNACDLPEFRDLVRAALFTGCRYGELTRLQVKDFNITAGTVFISESKSGKPRHVFLSDEGRDWFAGQAAGRAAQSLILVRENVKRTTRKAAHPGSGWADHDQKYYMALACKAAGIEPLGFHELRHTYASALVNAGVPLAYVASQLGHVDIAMVQKHYGHLCPSAMADAIRAAAPRLGTAAPKVAALKIGGSA